MDIKVYSTPQEYGAKADGITDDSYAFIGMFNAGVKFIFIPEGIYLINNSIVIPTGVTIIGESRQHTILMNGTGMKVYASTIAFIQCSNSSIANLTLDGNINNVSGDINRGVLNMRIQSCSDITVRDVNFVNNKNVGCNLVNSQRVRFDNCYFNNIDSGINGQNGTTNDTIRISNCTFDGHSKSDPIAIPNAKNITVEHCKMLNKTEGHAVTCDGSQNVLITDCYVYNCCDGFYLTSRNNARCNRIKIKDCIFDTCTHGPYIGHADNVEVSGCTFIDESTNIVDSTNVDFINNKFIANTKPSMISFSTSKSDKLRFINNIIDNTNNMNYGAGFLAIYSVAITNILFEKNTFINSILYNGEFVTGSIIKVRNNYDSTGNIYVINKACVFNENSELFRVIGLIKPTTGFHNVGEILLYNPPTRYIGGVNLVAGYGFYAVWSSGMKVWPSLQIKLSNGTVVKAMNSGTCKSGTEPIAITSSNTGGNPYIDTNGISWVFLGTACNFVNFGALE